MKWKRIGEKAVGGMSRLSPLLRATASLVAILLACLTPFSIAYADATFVKSGPSPNSTVDARFQVVNIVFSEGLDPARSAIVVTGSDGSRADQGDAHLDPLASQVMVVSLKPGRPFGRYTVGWTSLSAVDGRTRTGSFDFMIAPVVQTVPEPNATVKWALPDNAVEVVLGEPLNPRGSSIAVVGPDGARADQGDAAIDPKDPAQSTLRVSLVPNARAGTYQVAWTAVAAKYGSTFSGSFRFTLLQDQKPGLPAGTSPEPNGGNVAEVSQLPKGGEEPGRLSLTLGGMLLLAGLTIRRWSGS